MSILNRIEDRKGLSVESDGTHNKGARERGPDYVPRLMKIHQGVGMYRPGSMRSLPGDRALLPRFLGVYTQEQQLWYSRVVSHG